MEVLNFRRAQPDDCALVTGVVTLAFAADPLWSWAMSRADMRVDHHHQIWNLFVEGALRYPDSWIAEEGEAASVWIPPSGTEMSDDQEARLHECLTETLGPGASRFRELLAHMEDSHPRSVDHYYLSLLGTDPNFRGRGVGMRLLAHDLEMIDAVHSPAYLESSNPNNNNRYRSVGFEAVGEFQAPNGGPFVTTMWRSAR